MLGLLRLTLDGKFLQILIYVQMLFIDIYSVLRKAKYVKFKNQIFYTLDYQSIWLQLVRILDIVHRTYCKSSDKQLCANTNDLLKT